LFSLSPDETNGRSGGQSMKNRWILWLLERSQPTRNIIFMARTAIYVTICIICVYGIRYLLYRSVDSFFFYFLVAASLFFLLLLFDGILPKYIMKNCLSRIAPTPMPTSKDSDEQEMLDEIHHFYQKTADEIMIPRLDMTAIHVECDFKEALDIVIETGFSRIPVYEETEDNIKGILYVKDLLPVINNPESIQWKNLIRPAYFGPETKKIDDLLEEFRTTKTHLAVVVDEFGGTSGIVTLEDILEEIVGEINDEYDEEDSKFARLADGSYLFDAKILLTDFFRATGLDSKSFGKLTDEADTLAGLILEIKGDFPEKKEVVEYKPYTFQILEIDRRRILKVKFTKNEE
jgi:Mg2+/Co2+ transporter CorC